MNDDTEKLEMERKRLVEAQAVARIGSWELDLRTNVLSWSKENYRIFGIEENRFGASYEAFLEIIHPDDRAAVNRVYTESVANRTAYEIIHRLLLKDGSIRFVSERCRTFYDENGLPLRSVGTTQDITERRLAEEEINFQAHLLNNVEQAVIATDLDGKVRYWNRFAERLYGWTAEEARNRHIFELTTPETSTNDAEEILSQLRANKSWAGDFNVHHKNGAAFFAHVANSPILNGEGELVGIVGVSHDITERKQMEVEQAKLSAELAMEKARLQHIINHSPSFIVALRGEQFVFEVANPVYCQLVGQRKLIGIPAAEALPELVSQGFLELLERVYETGELFTASEMPLKLLNPETGASELRYSNFAYMPMREADASISGVLSYGIDVTEQVLSRKKIEESEERYRFLFENNPLPMWVFDVETLDFLAVNGAAIEQYGFTREEFLSMTVKDIRLPEDVDAFVSQIKKEFVGIRKSGVFRHRKKDGTTIYAETNSILLTYNERSAKLVLANDVTERKSAEEALRRAEASYRSLIELSPAIVYLAKPFPPFEAIYVSPNVGKFGHPPEEWFTKPDMWASIIHEEDRERILKTTQQAMDSDLKTDIEYEYRIKARDGSVHWVHDKGCLIFDEQGNKIGWQGIIVDVTETKKLEEQLRQAQKLESIGRLAGGIAHDFNNMLTAINGYSDLTLRRMAADDPLRANILEIKKAGDRSAELTHQLLAFSRQQVLKPKLVNLNDVVEETSKMLRRMLGEDIQFVSVANPKLGFVMADLGQMSQILMNLTVNARDAMPQGGTLTIETKNVFIEQLYTSSHAQLLPGAYVTLLIADTGEGMDEETLKHVFEPFFTTKEVGKGTGLGLATVYGIVKQSGGYIEIFSEPDSGTTFKIYLPRVAAQAVGEKIQDAEEKIAPASGTILLVEDEKLVLALAKSILEDYGYTVVSARNGAEALDICQAGEFEFDLLMTDVVMPVMGGRKLSEAMKEKLPGLKVLFTSGYTDDAVVRHGVIEGATNFIQKPFTPKGLAKKVGEILGVDLTERDAEKV